MRFDGSAGMRPSAQARRHVYTRLAEMLGTDLAEEAWMFDGITDEPDQRRLLKAIRAVAAEMARKGAMPKRSEEHG